MNVVSLIGRLTAEPELKHTQSGTPMLRFTVAVDRPTKQGEERQADFISCTAWNSNAEFISRYFNKGNRIGIVGTIRTGSYTANDGSKRYTTDVWVNNISFCESKGSSGGSGYGNNNNYNNNGGYNNNYNNNGGYNNNYNNNGGYNNNGYNNNSYNNPPEGQEQAPSSYSNGSDGDFRDVPNDKDLPF